jgi:putative tryptophan/tyrosine transport system substrate-binding protein
MRRRRFVIAGFAAMLLASNCATAQQAPAKIPRVGILTQADTERTPILDAFREGLHDLGYVEGRNVVLEFRFARGDLTRGLRLSEELVNLPVEVIVIEGVPAAMDPSGQVPIVGPALVDPVQRGFALSLARPGRNITGFTLMHTELNGKRLELLRTAFPQITAVSALVKPRGRGLQIGSRADRDGRPVAGSGEYPQGRGRERLRLARSASSRLFRSRRGGDCAGRRVL